VAVEGEPHRLSYILIAIATDASSEQSMCSNYNRYR